MDSAEQPKSEVTIETGEADRPASGHGSEGNPPSWAGTLSPSGPTPSPTDAPDQPAHMQHSPPALKAEPHTDEPPLMVKSEPPHGDQQASAKRRDAPSPNGNGEKRQKVKREVSETEKPPVVKKEEPKEDIVKKDEEMELIRWTAARRPDTGGTRGRKFPVISNHFLIDVMPKLQSLEQYEVDVEPVRKLREGQTRRPLPKLSKSRKQELAQRNWEVFQAMIKTHKNVFGKRALAYDKQRLLLSVDPLGIPEEGQIFEVLEPPLSDGRHDSFEVKVKPVGQVDIGSIDSVINEDLDARCVLPLQAIDVILRQGQYASQTYFQCGSNFYRPTQDMDLGMGKFLHKGFHMSAKPVQNWKPIRDGPTWQLSLNVDVANSVFYAAVDLYDYICRFLNHDPRNTRFDPQRELEQASRHIKLLKVKTGKAVKFKRIFKPKGLHQENGRFIDSTMVKFNWEPKDGESREINVRDYFREKYHIKLKYPEFPLVVSGTKDRVTYYPAEVLEVYPDQKVPNGQLKPEQLQNIIRSAAAPPKTRAEQTERLINDAKISRDPIAASFGLKVSDKMARFDARVMEPPMMKFMNKREMPNRGTWNLKNNKYIEGGKPLKSWAIINCARDVQDRNLQDFFNNLRGAALYNGLEMRPEPKMVKTCRGLGDIQAAFEDIKKNVPDLQLVFSVVGNKPCLEYSEIKRCGDTLLGIMTQNFTSRSLKMMGGPKGAQALLNITHELTYKLNGVTAQIDTDNKTAQKYFYDTQEPALFIGAGISHPGPGSSSPSIAAIAANIDLHPSRYVAQVRIQEKEMEETETKVRSRRSIIIELKEMVVNALRAYYKYSKIKPTRIVLYREGVSEGQFLHVLQSEVTAVREACKQLQEDYQPGITFIVVQKGQHTVFFPERSNNPKENVPPGTVVDTKVVHPTEFDFHMVSSQGIQGTSRPIHYHVLHDDNNFSSDEIQEVTFYLTHLYGRCSRSVSVPTPVYYADLIATRAREHMKVGQSERFETMSASSGGDRGYSAEQIAGFNKIIRIHKDTKNRMYFL